MPTAAHPTQPTTPALLRLPTVCALVGLSKSQVYRLARAGEFPSAVRIGANSVAWPAEQVHGWIAAKIGGAGEVRA